MRPMQQAEPYIVCDNLVKIYQTEDLEVVALQGLDLEIQRGEMMAIIGNSGSGKSTLLEACFFRGFGGIDCLCGFENIVCRSYVSLSTYWYPLDALTRGQPQATNGRYTT